ncbi:TolC family protein [Mesonia mobilis]|uniref:Transporter n=1 Tax=Mesonia mobilis TaxID=369791 RepID=A0ABQ3BL57_9FLAO|nr:TolC family protein [Mesonia mobilis]MBQ0738196.1 TolC family protein [Aquimarina celericrescens]GGZ45058.1 transporter [Mesonia mobilis]
MKKITIIAALLGLVFSASAQEGKKWTLRECVEYALENNISVKQSELDLENAKLNKMDAIGNLLPTLNGNASYTTNTGASINPTTNQFENETFSSFTTGASSSLTLFDGLRNIRQLQRAKLSRLASQYQLEKMESDIALAVANSYLQVLLNKANLEAIKSQNEVSQEQLERTQNLVDAGTLPQGDLLEIKATIANETQQIVVAENNIQISLISLAQLLLIEDYETFQIVDEGYEVISTEIADLAPQEIIRNAQSSRPEVKIAEKNVELAEKDVEIARGSYYPTLSAFFNYNTRYSDNDFLNRNFTDQLWQNDGLGYGFRLNVPIFNGLSVRTNVKRNKINLQRTEYQLEQAKLDLESNVYQAYVDAKGAAKSYEAALSALESQELAFEYATDRYEVGLTNAFDFSQSKQRFDNAKINVNQAKYDYIFKLKVLELYFGVAPEDIKL